MKKLVKKLILALNFRYLTSKSKLQKMTSISAAHDENSGFVPSLSPTTIVVNDKIAVVNELYIQRAVLEEEIQGITKDIQTKESELENIFVDKWMKQTQDAINGDETKAKTLGYDIKGEQAELNKASSTSIENSVPLIAGVSFKASLTQEIEIINSESKDYILPFDAQALELYEFIGDAEPSNIKKMTYLGPVKRGKFINHFEEADKGKIVWYIAVYRGKDSTILSGLSLKVRMSII